jgi:hypothetical protein
VFKFTIYFCRYTYEDVPILQLMQNHSVKILLLIRLKLASATNNITYDANVAK